MAAVAAKDAKAQEVLLRRLSGRVLRLTRALCGSGADADDASQQALLEILRSGANFRVESSIEHWADRITIRCVMRALRRERRRRGLLRRYSVEEIADMTGAPQGTVKDRLVTGRKQMRQLLQREIMRATTGRSGNE